MTMREFVAAEIVRHARLREQAARIAEVSRRGLNDDESWQEQVRRQRAEAGELREIAGEILSTEHTENTEGEKR